MQSQLSYDDTVRVTIIEDDRTIREGYQYLLSNVPQYEVCSVYDSAEAALRTLHEDLPDIILLDIQLPGQNGIDAIPPIRALLPAVKVIMLTAHEDPELIFKALSNGASGYLSKSIPAAKLIDAIKDIIDGGGSFSAGIARLIIDAFQKNTETPLTRREEEVLQLIADGKSRTQIAQELFVDLETIKTHIKNIYFKLDVHSRADAIKIGRKNRFIR
jgi:DNA-binding NarL/FixJ family response regulator